MARKKSTESKRVSASGRTCAIAGCGRPEQAKGLCHAHYVRQAAGRQLQGKIRPMRARLTPKERKELADLYRAGKPISHLAAEYEVAKSAVQRLLRLAGLR